MTGDAIVGAPAPAPTTARPTPAPTAAPTKAPTPAPTQAPTRPPTTKAPVTEAPAVAQVVAVQAVHAVPVQAVHAVPIQYLQLAHALPQQYSALQFHSGFNAQCFYAASELSRSGEQEVIGFDGARYILKKIE